MKLSFRYAFVFVMLTFFSLTLAAQNKANKTIYGFAVATCFNDSTIYISAISPLDGAQLEKKTHFLSQRSAWSSEFKMYLDSKYGDAHTSAFFFDTKKDKLEKKLLKLRRQYAKNKTLASVVEVPATDFSFTPLTSSTE